MEQYNKFNKVIRQNGYYSYEYYKKLENWHWILWIKQTLKSAIHIRKVKGHTKTINLKYQFKNYKTNICYEYKKKKVIQKQWI